MTISVTSFPAAALGSLRRLPAALARPVSLQRLDPRRELVHLLSVFLPLLALYLLTAPRTVVLEDDGLFILSGYFLGIEHPPGYPLYVLFAKLATLIPFGSVAWRVHALSGLFAALACVFVYVCTRLLIPGRLPAYLAALGYGVSLTFWSQALIADVYSLNSLLFFALLFLCLREGAAPAGVRVRERAPWFLIGLLGGLGLANHWPLLVLSSPALLLILWPRRREVVKRLPVLAVAVAVGLLPYAWMVWRSRMLPEISFSGPIDDWSEFLYYVRRSGYVEVDTSATAGWEDKLGYIGFLVRQAVAQMTPVGFLLALAGLWGQRSLWPPSVRAGLLAAFLGPTLALVLMLDFDDQWLQRLAFRVYPLVAWGIMALWAALGLHVLCARMPARARAPTAVSLVVLTVGLSMFWHRGENDRHAESLGRDYAETVLRSLAPDAVLFLAGDAPTGTISYLNRVEGIRPDVTVMSEDGLLLEPRLFDPVTTSIPDRARAVDDYVRRSERPVYFLHDLDGSPGERTWLTFRPARGELPGDTVFRILPSELDFLASITGGGELSDGWSELVRRRLLRGFASVATKALLAGDPTQGGQDLAAALDKALEVPEAKVARAQELVIADLERYSGEIGGLISAAAVEMDQRTEKTTQAEIFLLAARLAAHQGRAEVMRSALERAFEAWPDPSNPAKSLLDGLPEASPGKPKPGT